MTMMILTYDRIAILRENKHNRITTHHGIYMPDKTMLSVMITYKMVGQTIVKTNTSIHHTKKGKRSETVKNTIKSLLTNLEESNRESVEKIGYIYQR
jgi:hypothetical protein